MDLLEIIHRIKEECIILRSRASVWQSFVLWKSQSRCLEEGMMPTLSVIYDSLCFGSVYHLKNDFSEFADGEFLIFGERQFLGRGSSWLCCPITGYKWPSIHFSKLDYRTVGKDVRYIWEKNRFYHLIFNNADELGLSKTVENLKSWMEENKPYKGPNYISTMECSFRVVHLFLFLSKCSNARVKISEDHKKEIGKFVYLHRRVIVERFSLFSSTGNHTVLEYIGVVLATALLNDKCIAAQKVINYKAALEEQLLCQIREDGGGLENSIAYLNMIYGYSRICQVVLDNIGFPFSCSVLSRLDDAELFLNSCFSGVPYFEYGDDDSSYVPICSAEKQKESELKLFPVSKIATVNNARLKLLFNCSDMGMHPLFGHSHLDTLSVALIYDDNYVFIDSGTYSYSSNDNVRAKLRSQLAHNGPWSPRGPVLSQPSRFMWEKNIASELRILKNEGDQTILRGIVDSVNGRFQRTIVLDDAICFVDRALDGGEIEVRFTLKPDCIYLDGGVCKEGGQKVPVSFICNGGKIVPNIEKTVVSQSYSNIEPTTVLVLRGDGTIITLVGQSKVLGDDCLFENLSKLEKSFYDFA